MSLRQAPGPYGLGPTDSWISDSSSWCAPTWLVFVNKVREIAARISERPIEIRL